MDVSVGSILEGKVTGITKFAAFVSLPERKSGMVHISEVAHSYVSNISDFLSEGQTVSVKVLQIDSEGRINLSIKQAQAPATPAKTPERVQRPRPVTIARPGKQAVDPSTLTFEEKMKRFMQDSESRLSDVKHHRERKNGTRRKR